MLAPALLTSDLTHIAPHSPPHHRKKNNMKASQKTPILIATGVVTVLAVALTGAVVFAKKGKGDGAWMEGRPSVDDAITTFVLRGGSC